MTIPDTVIVLLCIISAAFAVTCGYAVTRFWFKDPVGVKPMGNEQQAYMRDVRMRNQQVNMGEAPRQKHYAEGERY
jgi:hypothetical protein